MYRITVWSTSSLGPFCWRVLSDCAVTLVRGAQTRHVGVPRCRRLGPSALVRVTSDISGYSNLSTTRYDLTPTGQRGKLYEKIFFTFDFHILPEHRRIGDKIFPCRCISIKNGDHPWGRCWPIYLESKPSLNCWIAVERVEITFISIHINANQNSYHDDKSIL